MIKKVTLLTTLGAITIGIAIGVSANGIVQKVQSEIRGDFVIKTNGQIQTLKSVDGETVYPMLYEGTTYLPVRAIAELNNKLTTMLNMILFIFIISPYHRFIFQKLYFATQFHFCTAPVIASSSTSYSKPST